MDASMNVKTATILGLDRVNGDKLSAETKAEIITFMIRNSEIDALMGFAPLHTYWERSRNYDGDAPRVRLEANKDVRLEGLTTQSHCKDLCWVYDWKDSRHDTMLLVTRDRQLLHWHGIGKARSDDVIYYETLSVSVLDEEKLASILARPKPGISIFEILIEGFRFAIESSVRIRKAQVEALERHLFMIEGVQKRNGYSPLRSRR